MSKKTRDSRQMPLDFDLTTLVDVKDTVCQHRLVRTAPMVPAVRESVCMHATFVGATIVSFTDAGTLALRRRAVQRVINAGIFPTPLTKITSKD
ncbi:hypothetical protein [uncultured Sphingomonas sp.]|uniref:hypothetical protein n=1 Tax=uncultured Sphingomonas sp. TaxID=158754 RepID=UPI0025D5C0A6|nr:hypothetical protein [uncultured Sphingomonas sp.]